MPSNEGIRSEPGRERERERKREEGAFSTGVMEKRLDAHAAPSGELFVTGGIFVAMMELRGSARPRMPLKSGVRGSSVTLVAAAKAEGGCEVVKGKWKTKL